MIPISLEGPSVLRVKIKSASGAKSYENTNMCLGIQVLYTITIIVIRVFHFYTFFELSLVLLTSQAHGL